MAQLRFTGGRYEARCERCGAWQAVEVRQLPCDLFFEYYQANSAVATPPRSPSWPWKKTSWIFIEAEPGPLL